jgi:hypothetical protein
MGRHRDAGRRVYVGDRSVAAATRDTVDAWNSFVRSGILGDVMDYLHPAGPHTVYAPKRKSSRLGHICHPRRGFPPSVSDRRPKLPVHAAPVRRAVHLPLRAHRMPIGARRARVTESPPKLSKG